MSQFIDETTEREDLSDQLTECQANLYLSLLRKYNTLKLGICGVSVSSYLEMNYRKEKNVDRAADLYAVWKYSEIDF